MSVALTIAVLQGSAGHHDISIIYMLNRQYPSGASRRPALTIREDHEPSLLAKQVVEVPCGGHGCCRCFEEMGNCFIQHVLQEAAMGEEGEAVAKVQSGASLECEEARPS